MKLINVTIDDELFRDLNALSTHHGHRMHLLRTAIKKMVEELKQKRNGNVESNPTNRT